MKKTNDIKKQNNLIWFVVLHIILFVMSFSGICSKLASNEKLFSLKFVLFYSLAIVILGVYAVFWQQIIKHISLTTAFCNKAVGIVWGMIWGLVFFKETIKWNMVLGAIIVIFGVIVVVKSDE